MVKIMRKEFFCNFLWLIVVCEEFRVLENSEDIDKRIEILLEGFFK